MHALGLPGLAFRTELKRVYPLGALAGHMLGTVNTDNRGIAGIERMLDEAGRVGGRAGPRTHVQAVAAHVDRHRRAARAGRGAQAGGVRYAASAAAGLVLDAGSGEVLAAVSLPEVDPLRPADWLDPAHADRLTGGTFELGSIFKIITVAMALEAGTTDLDKVYDVRQPLVAGSYTIKDLYPQGRPLTVREIFLHSSNVGAGMLALEVGAERQRAFLERLGLTEPMRTEAGAVAPPLLPKHWGRIETITVGYGHGLAVAPLQFAAAAAALVNGGVKVTPTLLARSADGNERPRVVSAATSARLSEIMRLNVTNPGGTGRHAEAEGYRVGGKTGTAEMPGRGGYREKSVISSFPGAFPMDAPRYVVLVSLFEPQTGEAVPGASRPASMPPPPPPASSSASRPCSGVLPRRLEARAPEAGAFDAPREAQ